MRVSQLALQLIFFLVGIALLIFLFRFREDTFPAYPGTIALLGAVVTIIITASKGPFRFLALGFRSVIDVALDITNWLRIHPLERNPRARISARYVSLLRHICQWIDPVDGSRYDAIVIIAHSQGAVISAEILRFLQNERGDPELARLYDGVDSLPIYLFTMGCPLRQLYSIRFPDLYGWAWHDDPAWPGSQPDPVALGLKLWANAYRSGDYVGRYLWFSDTDNARWSSQRQGPQGGRLEFCIGAGAHTHYWDQTPPDEIGVLLDQLISGNMPET
jgi:hypothetical protein